LILQKYKEILFNAVLLIQKSNYSLHYLQNPKPGIRKQPKNQQYKERFYFEFTDKIELQMYFILTILLSVKIPYFL